MTDEERLAEIQSRAKIAQRASELNDYYKGRVYQDRQWLLEYIEQLTTTPLPHSLALLFSNS